VTRLFVFSGVLLAANLGVTPDSPLASAQSVVYPGARWETATPQEAGMDPAKFNQAMAALPSPAVVIRRGKIVGSKGDITRGGFIWSASKSLTALIAARLVQQGRIIYDTTVPGSNVPTDPLASYRQFMSMTSDFHLSPHKPGEQYAYNNGAVVHYGDYMKDTYFPGRTYVEALKDAYLTVTGSEDPLDFSGYISGWGGGWLTSTRDLARVGYLVLRNGSWNGQQVIPASFVNDLHQNQVPPAATESPDRSDAFYNEHPIGTPDLPGAYSFGFWLPHKRPFFGGSQSVTEAVAMSGAFGTTVFISRTKDLVIAAVNTSQVHSEGKISGAALDLFANAIVDNSPPGFSLTAGSSSRVVPVRGGASYVITVVPSNGFTGLVDFSVSGLPGGANAGFNPPSVNTSGSTIMAVSWGAGTPAGIYQLTIAGAGGGLRQTVSVRLAVARPPIVRSSPRIP
jgi:CubicO group peptidase (beta-lactamase class C family)